MVLTVIFPVKGHLVVAVALAALVTTVLAGTTDNETDLSFKSQDDDNFRRKDDFEWWSLGFGDVDHDHRPEFEITEISNTVFQPKTSQDEDMDPCKAGLTTRFLFQCLVAFSHNNSNFFFE